jgi:hypothetical protein
MKAPKHMIKSCVSHVARVLVLALELVISASKQATSATCLVLRFQDGKQGFPILLT